MVLALLTESEVALPSDVVESFLDKLLNAIRLIIWFISLNSSLQIIN